MMMMIETFHSGARPNVFERRQPSAAPYRCMMAMGRIQLGVVDDDGAPMMGGSKSDGEHNTPAPVTDADEQR